MRTTIAILIMTFYQPVMLFAQTEITIGNSVSQRYLIENNQEDGVDFPRFRGTVVDYDVDGRVVIALSGPGYVDLLYTKIWGMEYDSAELFGLISGRELACSVVYTTSRYSSSNCMILRDFLSDELCSEVGQIGCNRNAIPLNSIISRFDIGDRKCSLEDLENLENSAPYVSQLGGDRSNLCTSF